jgi:hypothetical protein
MSFDLHHPTDTTLGTGVAVAIAVSGLAILVGGFSPDGDEVLQARGHRLAATLDRLGFAHAFAYGEVLQAASDAVYVSATGRPEREHRGAQHEGTSSDATGRPEREPEVGPDGEPSSPPQPVAF